MHTLRRAFFAVALAVLGIVTLIPAAELTGAQGADSRTFPETGQTVKGAFLNYWNVNGALPQQGFPISGELQERSELDGKTYTVQYFERAVFEWHPEKPAAYNVLLTQLGTLRYRQKYPSGAPGQMPNMDPGTWVFKETGKRLGGSFLVYWKDHGGLSQFGFPISDEMKERSELDGKEYTVQYFERAVFEWHPDNKPPYNVLLSQLGTFRHRTRYPQLAPQQPQPPMAPVRDWIAPANLSRGGHYDNLPSIAVSPHSGQLTVGWEQRDEAGKFNNTMVATFRDPGEAMQPQALQTTGFKQTGGVKLKRDAFGRKHVVWWGQTGSTVCNYYARLEADGRRALQETVPGTCGRQQKLTALAVGPDNTVHALFGRDNTAVYYYQRTDAGAWAALHETVTSGGIPTGVALTVSTGGVVMAAYRTGGDGDQSDIFAGVRTGNAAWAMSNVSAGCCAGCPGSSNSYNPSLAPDPSGGIRAAWADEQCEPRTDPRQNDIYYREWTPDRGWGGPPVRVVRDVGDAFENSIAVDNGGRAHIVYASDPGVHKHGDYRLFYVSGSGGSFSAPEPLFSGWGARATFHKSPSLEYSHGWLHLVFNSDHERSKEVYYSNRGLGR